MVVESCLPDVVWLFRCLFFFCPMFPYSLIWCNPFNCWSSTQVSWRFCKHKYQYWFIWMYCTGVSESIKGKVYYQINNLKCGVISVKLSPQFSSSMLINAAAFHIKSMSWWNFWALLLLFWNSVGDLDNLEIRLFQACSKTVIIRADKSNLVKLGALRRQFHIEHFPLIVQCNRATYIDRGNST